MSGRGKSANRYATFVRGPGSISTGWGGRFLEGLEGRTFFSAGLATHTVTFNQAEPSSGGNTPANGYSPAQIRQAYGFNDVTFKSGSSAVPGSGQGQTIAIIDAYNDPRIVADLAAFDSHFALPSANLKVVNQTGGNNLPASDPSWSSEIALDVEWAHAIAPAAKLLLVEASSASLSDLMAGVDYARHVAGVSVASMSWGGGEWSGETSYDSYFTTPPGHTGVTFVNAAGDGGQGDAEWPACSPNVFSVGGTSLQLQDASGTYGSETGWQFSSGGTSAVEKMPLWQRGLPAADTRYSNTSYDWRHGTYKTSTSANRSVPDAAFDADPNTGFAVFDSVPFQGESGWQVAGGTSAGAPQWAALIAIADQGRAVSGKTPLDGGTGTLPLLYGRYGTALYDLTLHDVTQGGKQWSSAAIGYDHVTGLGSPKAVQVILALGGNPVAVNILTGAPPVGSRVKTALERASVFRGLISPSAPPPGADEEQSGAETRGGAVLVNVVNGLADSPVPPSTVFVTTPPVGRFLARASGGVAGIVLNPSENVAERPTQGSARVEVAARSAALVPISSARAAEAPRSNSAGVASAATAGSRASIPGAAAVIGITSIATDLTRADETAALHIAPLLGTLSGSLWSRFSSLFAGDKAIIGPPGSGADQPLGQSIPGSILGLSPFNQGGQLGSDARFWEVTAAVCLGIAVAGYWYSSAIPQETESAWQSTRRVRRTRDGWELTPCEER